MKKLFAVIRSGGSAWRASRGLEEQERWRTHAAFKNGLAEEGFVVLGGPLEGSDDVLLIVRADTEQEIVQRLSPDPWSGTD